MNLASKSVSTAKCVSKKIKRYVIFKSIKKVLLSLLTLQDQISETKKKKQYTASL